MELVFPNILVEIPSLLFFANLLYVVFIILLLKIALANLRHHICINIIKTANYSLKKCDLSFCQSLE